MVHQYNNGGLWVLHGCSTLSVRCCWWSNLLTVGFQSWWYVFLWYRIRLEKEAEELSKAGDMESERLMDVYERLEELDASTAETKAARILHGLGQ